MIKRNFIRLLLAFSRDRGKDRFTPDELSLLRLADEISAVFKPVKPLPAFRKELSQRLALAAKDRIIVEQRPRWRWPILWGLLGSLISLIGVIVYLLYSRLSHRTPSAA